jgi:hypothetical protein
MPRSCNLRWSCLLTSRRKFCDDRTIFELTFPGPRVISLEELLALIGSDTVVARDRGGSWVFDPQLRRVKCLDGKFFDVRMFDRGAFEQPGVYEEPGMADRSQDSRGSSATSLSP